MTRVAAIDIGTNTVLLLVAEAREDGLLVAVDERATITRLGEGVDKRRSLLPAAIERTNACLSDYAARIRAHGVDRVAVVGTSAMRDAGGGEQVREHVRRELGIDARVISGEEEARLTFAGALSGLSLGQARKVTVFDIGGGSTEVVHGTIDSSGRVESIAYARSFDVGSVRLTERLVSNDPPTTSELDALRAAADAAFAPVPDFPASAAAPPPLARAHEIVGIAGTMTTLAAVSLRLDPYDGARVHGHTMASSEIDQCVQNLAKTPLAERRRLAGLEPKRADVIVAGGTIAVALLRRFGADRVRISDRGVRWGLAEQLASAE